MHRVTLAPCFALVALVGCGGCATRPNATSPGEATTAPMSAGEATNTSSKDVVEAMAAAGTFTTLAAALKQAGLVDTLKGPGPYTIFAPTDDAFKKLPQGGLAALMADADKLKALLTYHVVPGKLTTEQLAPMHSVKTVNGEYLAIATLDAGGVTVNDARFGSAMEASNGLVYAVDLVLLPPDDEDTKTQAYAR